MKKRSAFKVFCTTCKTITNHHIVKEHIVRWGNEDIQGIDEFEIIECNGCEDISFRKVSTSSEDYDFESGKPIESVKVYPKRNKYYREIKNYWHAGNTVNKIYKETLECYNNDLPILCTAGLRAIIESICADKGVNGGTVIVRDKLGEPILDTSSNPKTKFSKNLEGKINGLSESRYITQDQSAILHQLRLLGNDALHNGEEPELDNILTDCIGIIEHILDTLYEIGMKNQRLQRQRTFSKQVSVHKKRKK